MRQKNKLQERSLARVCQAAHYRQIWNHDCITWYYRDI